MRLRHIEVFNAIMVTGTVSAAARLLSLTQPAVTQILKSMELQLGYELFERARGRLMPTNEARTLYAEVEKLEHQLEAVKALAHNLKRSGHTRLRVLAAPALAQTLVPFGLGAFLDRHPRAAISIQSQYSRKILESLALHEADLGIIYQSVPHPVIVEELIAEGYLVCAASRASAPARTSIRLEDLVDQPVLVSGTQDPLGRLLVDTCRERGVAISDRLEMQQYHAALSSAANGLGMAVIDSFTALSADPKRVAIMRIEPRITFQVKAAYAVTGQRSHLAKEFIASLRRAAQAIQSG